VTPTGKVRLGFIGAGWWATANHLPLLAARDDVELAAVCRLGRAELEAVRERFGFPFATEDYRALLEQPLDGVVVASPHGLHYEHTRAALERGLHVMVEKPMCRRAAEAWALAGQARQRGRHLLVPYGWNYQPFVEEAQRRVAAGAYSCDVPPRRFVELIRGGPGPNNSPPEVAARSVELLEAAYRAAASGRTELVTV
jgi:predicted dehydrogenase